MFWIVFEKSGFIHTQYLFVGYIHVGLGSHMDVDVLPLRENLEYLQTCCNSKSK